MPRIDANDADRYQTSNGEWFSLKNDGDVARVQFMINEFGELDTFACHKIKPEGQQYDSYVDCLRTYDDPVDMCPLCLAGIPQKLVRYVVMYDLNDKKVKQWERGNKFIKKIEGLCNRYSPLSEHVFEIERHGKAGSKDTTYDIFPVDDEPVDISGINKPEFLGTIIAEKSAEDMEYFLDYNVFPSGEEASAAPQVSRRAPVAKTQEAPRGSRRSAAPQGSRRSVAPQAAPQTSRRARRAPAEGNEVF